MDPTGTIADGAAIGAVLGAALARFGQPDALTEFTANGMIIGGFAGGLRVLLGALI